MSEGSTIGTLIVTAIALAADAFIVSIACGLACKEKKELIKVGIKTGIAFGVFQGGMTFLGWALGLTFKGLISGFDHWVAFVILAIIGGKMIKEAIGEDEAKSIELTTLKMLIILAIATSIDALAVGISFAVINMTLVNIIIGAIIIGVITCVLSFLGAQLGNKLGSNTKFQDKINIAGGVILILIGTKILIEHLMM